MPDWLHSILNSGFFRGIATLSSGQMIATAIPIAAAPILGRLYLPSEYGLLAAYMSIASVLSTIGNWQYSQAIIIERYDNKAKVLLQLCMLTSAITAAITSLIMLSIIFSINKSAEWHQIRFWFLALPVSTFIGGSTAAWSAMANRQQMYQVMAVIPIISVTLGVTTSIFLGLQGYSYTGLMIAYFLSQLISFLLYGYVTYKKYPKQQISRHKLLALARKHKEFAFFTTPSSFIGNFAMQSPIYVLGLIGATEMIGLFSRARQLLSMPITLLGGAVAQVFQRRAAADFAKDGHCRKIFIKTFLILGGTGLIPTVLLAVWAPDLFEIFLGENWRGAGNIARILAPMLLLRLICSPLSTVFYIVGAQREDFALMIFTTVLTCVAASLPMIFAWDSLFIVVGFSVAYSITYLLYLTRGYYHSKC